MRANCTMAGMRRGPIIGGVVFALAGCAFGTDYIRLPTVSNIQAPEHGLKIAVQVRDGRADMSGTQIGFKRSYGAKAGSVELEGGETLADRLAKELVALFRTRGYRASEGRPLPGDTDLDALFEVSSFAVDTQMGFFMGDVLGFAVVRGRVVDVGAKRVLWEDIARAEYRKPQIVAYGVTEDANKDAVRSLYQALIVKLRGIVPPKFATQ